MTRPTSGALLLAAALLGAPAADTTDGALRDAADAWDRGDYVAALTTYLELLDSPAADTVLEPIALQTGELFQTRELTADGGAPRFSPDGRTIVYEAGTGTLRTTRVVALTPAGELRTIATLQGHSASFSPDGSKLVYLRVPHSAALRELQARADRAAGLERARFANELAELAGQLAKIVVQDLARPSAAPTEISTGEVRASFPVAGADGYVVFVGWAAEGAPDQVYAARAGAAPRALTTDAADKTILDVNTTGTAVLFAPRRRSQSGGPTFGVVTLPDARVTRIEGSAPSFSADGRSLTYVSSQGGEHRVNVAPVERPDQASVVRRGAERLDAPALSADGGSVLFQMMPREDWEIFLRTRDGSHEARITREIQHDVLPRFLTPDRFLAAIGEPRHRRSHVYDWPSGERTRVFHNNSVRTIAPEYAWEPSPDGTRVLIVADRDGNTVSPERGVYLVDLTRRVTRADVRARVAANLQSEQALRATSARMFAPIEADVRRTIERVSTGRIFDYQKALFDADSKHITRPGNALAARYLFEAYRSFGYEPEYQWFKPSTVSGVETANVLATLPGTTSPDVVYVVSSHYDSAADGPGADDNSSGTAALLETARVLRDRPQPATIVFASFTGEESGLLGSREYVRRALADNRRIVGVVNNDMIGWANDHRLDVTVRHASPGLRDVQHAAAMQFTKLITYDARYYRNTDAHSFAETYGDLVTGLGSYPVLGNPHYHQPHDVLDTINHRQVTEVAKTTAATIMLLASSPSPLKGLTADRQRDGSARVSWTPAPEKDVTGYAVSWGPATNPGARQLTVPKTESTIYGVAAGTVIAVKAVNTRGLEGWDWARVEIR